MSRQVGSSSTPLRRHRSRQARAMRTAIHVTTALLFAFEHLKPNIAAYCLLPTDTTSDKRHCPVGQFAVADHGFNKLGEKGAVYAVGVGMGSVRRSEKRNPLRCRRERTPRSGAVSLPRMRLMFQLRRSGVRRSTPLLQSRRWLYFPLADSLSSAPPERTHASTSVSLNFHSRPIR